MRRFRGLQELADVTVGHVGPMVSEYRENGIPFLRSQSVFPHRIDEHGLLYITSEFHGALRKSRLKPGDVVIVRTGKPGTAAVIPEWLGEANCSDLVIVRPGPDLHSRWLSYFINASAQSFVGAHLVGAVQQHFNVGSARAMQIPIVELQDQRAIAEVLGALDDKIAANSRVVEVADRVAREVYNRFSRAELIDLADLADNPRTQAQPPFDDGVYVGLEHVPRRHMWLSEYGCSNGLASGKFCFEPGDVLFGKLRPYFHKVVVADRPGVCSTDILVVRPRSRILRGFVWAAVSSDSVVGRVSAMAEGTRMPRTSWSDLAACQIPWPGDEAAEKASRVIESLGIRASASYAESRQLAHVRDALLPHLMSGRITVRQAETLAEGVL